MSAGRMTVHAIRPAIFLPGPAIPSTSPERIASRSRHCDGGDLGDVQRGGAGDPHVSETWVQIRFERAAQPDLPRVQARALEQGLQAGESRRLHAPDGDDGPRTAGNHPSDGWREIRDKGAASRFRKTDRGKFALNKTS